MFLEAPEARIDSILSLFRNLRTSYFLKQIIVSVGAGPWDELFGGGNSPALVVAAFAAFVGGLIAMLAIPRTRIQKPRIQH